MVPVSRHPAYEKLAHDLIADIAAGRYALGERLPTEAQLCESTGLSRGTVRQALQQVERAGMINRRPRDGSRVVALSPVEEYVPVVGSADDIMSLVRRTKIVHPRVREEVAGRTLAGRLGAPVGSRWQVVEGVRVLREDPDVPLCWSEQYIPPGRSIKVLLRGEFTAEQAAATETEQIVTAEELDRRLAQVLRTDSAVALVVTRRHREAGGRLLSVGIHTHPGDRHSLRSVIAPRT